MKTDKAKVGDLIFFKGSNAKSKNVGHVGMITQINPDNTMEFIHASVHSGVLIDLYPGLNYYNIRFIGIKRILKEKDYAPSPAPQRMPLDEIEIIQGREDASQNDASPEPKKEEDATIEPTERNSESDADKTQTQGTTSKEDKSTKKKRSKRNRRSTGEKDKQGNANMEGKEKNKEENTEKKQTNNPKEIRHTVKQGETLYRLSVNYGCKVEDIQKWNNLKNNNIHVGQELIIHK